MKITCSIAFSSVSHLIPSIYISTLYQGLYISVYFLCLEVNFNIWSSIFKPTSFYISTPSIIFEQYVEGNPYLYKFEICTFGNTYRKSFCKLEETDKDGLYNTPGFVKSDYFAQFIETNYNMKHFNEFMQDMNELIDKYKEK